MSAFTLTVFIVAALIGIWALVGLLVAMIQNGGPLKLFQKWFKAVSGS